MPCSPTRRSRSTACRSWRRGASPTAASTPRSRGSCSSGTRWCRASGARTTRSSHANRELLEEVEELEHRAAATRHPRRRRDAVRLLRRASCPPTSCRPGTSTAGGRRRGAAQPDLLDFERAMLRARGRERGQRRRLPRRLGGGRAERSPLSYQFEPGTAADGVTVHIPLPVLNRVTPGRLRLAGPGAAARPGHRAAAGRCPRRCAATSCPPPTTPAPWSTCSAGRRARRRSH